MATKKRTRTTTPKAAVKKPAADVVIDEEPIEVLNEPALEKEEAPVEEAPEPVTTKATVKVTAEFVEEDDEDDDDVPLVTQPTEPAVEDHAGEIQWIKTGGGSFRHQGRIIKPNQKFWARPDDIPSGFRDIIRPVDPGAMPEAKALHSLTRFEIRAARGHDGFFNVVNVKSGKPINEKPLKPEAAATMLEALQ